MKRVYLLRHAKAVQPLESQDDFTRILNKRGREAARYMAGFITRASYLPDAVLCSPSARTQETLAPLLERLPATTPIRYDHALYHASVTMLLGAIRGMSNDAQSMLLVGHNPGIEELALALTDEPHSHFAQDIAQGFPTAGLAVIDCPADRWGAVEFRSARLVFFCRPRVLMDER